MTIKTILISIAIIIAVVGGAAMIVGRDRDSGNAGTGGSGNVTVVDGKQIITISAKGGYSPRVTSAAAGLPTVIKMDTQGTFDCSSALIIPSLSYQKYLPPSGETLIDVPPQQAGAKLQGLCSMGMYNFTVNFN